MLSIRLYRKERYACTTKHVSYRHQEIVKLDDTA
jgi:hypothetical protein